MNPLFRQNFDAAQDPRAAANALMLQPGVHVVSSGAAILGTTTNDSAAVGYVGEYVESIVSSSASITSGTSANVTSISLTRGDWDVAGNVSFTIVGNVTQTVASVSTTSATVVASPNPGRASPAYASAAAPIINSPDVNVAPRRVSLGSSGSAFLVALATFTTSGTVKGAIWARRVR